jgi:hypothetical protein
MPLHDFLDVVAGFIIGAPRRSAVILGVIPPATTRPNSR